MHYRISYKSRFEFGESISEQQVELRLVPRESNTQKLLKVDLQIDPTAELYTYRDAYGNPTHAFSLLSPHSYLEIRLEAEVENNLENPFNYLPPSPAQERDLIQNLLKTQPLFWDFLLPSGSTVPAISDFHLPKNWPHYDTQKNLLLSVQQAVEWIQSEIRYEAGSTDVHCPLSEILEKRSGVCQDFAHLLCTIVRSWGFPARYVMGYQFLEDVPNSETNPATHAWTEVYLPGAAWRGFDATQQLLANHSYIPVAVGRDSRDAAPERGSFRGSNQGLKPEIHLAIRAQ